MGVGSVQIFRAVVSQSRVRVCLVEHKAFRISGKSGDDRANAVSLQRRQRLRRNLQVPCVVDISGLQRRARRRLRVTAAKDDDAVKVGLLAPVVRVALVLGPVVGNEFDDTIRARAKGCGVLLVAVPRRRAGTVAKLGLADDGCASAHEGVVRIRRWPLELDADRAVIHRRDVRDAKEGVLGAAAGLLIRAVAPGEDDVAGGEVAAVRPLGVLPQRPRY